MGPGRREEPHTTTDAAARGEEAERTWFPAGAGVVCTRPSRTRKAAAATPMKTYHAGETLCAPTRPWEARFVLTKGRVRVLRERHRSDSVLTTAARRIATVLTPLTSAQPPAGPLRPVGRHPQTALTHEQLTALAGTSRETCTEVLRDCAGHGLLHLARGRITVHDPERLKDAAD
ncbi:helix-turn-helix domain-containing protein [Streptomyces antibioticus]|uniref:helix-turn-helix domain-containing protein n=1 Tax=Streptomyces antibioticus TaxID=1890 RepID=UPI003D72A44A